MGRAVAERCLLSTVVIAEAGDKRGVGCIDAGLESGGASDGDRVD